MVEYVRSGRTEPHTKTNHTSDKEEATPKWATESIKPLPKPQGWGAYNSCGRGGENPAPAPRHGAPLIDPNIIRVDASRPLDPEGPAPAAAATPAIPPFAAVDAIVLADLVDAGPVDD
ncbi:hypothetical protein PoHVEF18_009591 [Penicillium ochrochloron]